YVVSAQGISTDPEKIRAVQEFPKYIKESSVESLRITDSTIEFLDRQGNQVPINLAPEINDDLLET
ncbi:8148_t:CDS:2, partial [Racocetra persica]